MEFEGLSAVVAEDEAINRMYLTRVLQAAGLRVFAVKDGEAAVAEANRDDRPDFVLMDLTMPRLTGLEAAAAIRSFEADRGLSAIPIIALTAHARSEDRKACEEAGMNGFVSKPILELAMWEEIRRVLKTR